MSWFNKSGALGKAYREFEAREADQLARRIVWEEEHFDARTTAFIAKLVELSEAGEVEWFRRIEAKDAPFNWQDEFSGVIHTGIDGIGIVSIGYQAVYVDFRLVGYADTAPIIEWEKADEIAKDRAATEAKRARIQAFIDGEGTTTI